MTHEHYLQAWQESQELAEAMQPLIGRLYRQQGIEITIFYRPLQNASTIDILKAHRVVRRHQGAPPDPTELSPAASHPGPEPDRRRDRSGQAGRGLLAGSPG